MKYIIIILIVIISSNATGQITHERNFEKTYGLDIINLEDDGNKYFVIDTQSKDVMLFNENHTLFKRMKTPVPQGSTFHSTGILISKRLFDNDNEIEYAYSFYGTSFSGMSYTTIIVDENGKEEYKFEETSYIYAKMMNGKWKILTSRDVYSVPGTYTGMLKQTNGQESAETGIYPNPMQDAATITYQLPQGVNTGTIEVYNTQGMLLRTYTVTSQFKDILVQRGELPAGVYTYRLKAAGTTGMAQNFVVD